jgi:hypothetical protein
MTKQIKLIARFGVLVLTVVLLATSLPGCKANKCDCPTFGGHRLKH